MDRDYFVRPLLLCAAISLIGITDLAEAQQLEEVLVTARKRTESLQDVPMAVSTFSADQLRNAQVDNILDLERMTPNLTLTTTGGLTAGSVSVFIRGIGNDAGFDQGVGIYVDDVYLNRPSGALLEVFDVERVEVLKGPQGNLYGRNTIGGAIKFISSNPTEELTGRVEVTGGEFDLWKVKGSVSGPIMGDTLLGKLGVMYKERDGIQTNTLDGDDYWSEDETAFRGALLWNATDSLRVKLAGDYSKSTPAPAIPNRVAVDAETLAKIDFVIGGANTYLAPGLGLVDSPNDASLPMDIDHISTDFVDAFDNYQVETSTLALTVEWEINDNWSAKSITANRTGDNITPYDFDGSTQQFITTSNHIEPEDFTQEFQFNYDADAVHAVMGLYYLNGQDERPAFSDQYARLRAIDAQTKDTYRADRDIISKSVYATVDWNVTEKWQLSVGGRYTEDEKEETTLATVNRGYYAYAGLQGFPTNAVVAIEPGKEALAEQSPLFAYWASSFTGQFNTRYEEVTFAEDTYNKDSWSQFSPSARVTWFATDDLMFYTAYQQGFKSGGFQRDSQDADSYKPETVDAYSVGMKSTWLDGALRLNGEAFYSEYDDKQLQTIVLTTGDIIAQVGNVGTVETAGVELEMVWLPPVDGLVLGLNAGYLDADITSYESGGEDIADTTALGFSPKWTAQGRVSYDFDVADLGSVTVGADVSYRDESYTNSPIDLTDPLGMAQFQNSYVIWNALAAFTTVDQRWRVALEGKNLADKRVLLNTYKVGPFVTGAYNMPRTWAISVAYQF